MKITIEQAKRLQRKIKKIIKDKELKTITKLKKDLFELGFKECDLGTGESSRIKSLEVDIREIKTNKFLNGFFLIVGKSSIQYGQGALNRGFVIEIEKKS